MAYMGLDLIAVILLRLPVKSLLRFRCVAKPWRELIDDRVFIKSHLNLSIETRNSLSVIIRSENKIYSLPFDMLNGRITELDWPFKYSTCKAQFMGCCDGLVCLGIGEDNAVIWNYATRKYREIPRAPVAFPENHKGRRNMIFDIGYDSVSDDYKIVRIAHFSHKVCDLEVRVYSLKLNKWRRVQGLPYILFDMLGFRRQVSVLVCGALHWLACHNEDFKKVSIVAFDLAAEEHQLLPVPDVNPFNWLLGELGGCICVFLCNSTGTGNDVWVMKDYGVKDSWSQLFSVLLDYPLRFAMEVPLTYSNSSREILMFQYFRKFAWYDLERKTREGIHTLGLPNLFGAKICVESLVPVKIGESDANEQDKR